MDAEAWHARWREGKIGFHQAQVNRYLVQYWDQLGVPAGHRVFVPLCGKSLDMAWLARQGLEVVGVEIDERAVHAFFEEGGWTATVSEAGGLRSYSAHNVRLILGDLFALEPEALGPVSAIYDRAALVALPAASRPRYVAQLLRLAPGAPILLVTMEYAQHEMTGPPFSVLEAEVRALFADTMQIHRLVRSDVLEAHERFRARGLSGLHETAYLLRPKTAAPA